MRQQNSFFLKRKMDAFFASILKKKMDAKFASTIHSQISQSEAFLSLGLFGKTTLQIVPKNELFICTSSLQVLCHYLQVEFTSAI
jgi:hypothetical protein